MTISAKVAKAFDLLEEKLERLEYKLKRAKELRDQAREVCERRTRERDEARREAEAGRDAYCRDCVGVDFEQCRKSWPLPWENDDG